MKRRVLIFHPHFTIAGGAGTFVLEVGSRLHDSGYQVIILCIRQNPDITAAFQEKLTFIELGGELSSSMRHWLSLPYFLFRIFRIANAVKAEIIFPQVFPANWWGFLYALFNRSKDYAPKVVWMCQEPSAFIHSRKWISAIKSPLKRFIAVVLNPLFKLVDLRLVRQADYIFANSGYGADYAKQVYNLNDDRISHVYLAADPDFYLGDKSPYFEKRQNQIVTVCRLTKFKNVDFLIRLAARLNAENPEPIKLKIIGRGEEEQDLKELADRLNLQEHVEFMGSVSKEVLISTLAASRVFTLASIDEPFGLSIVEALACGTPAVVFNSAGPSEIVQDGICGYLVPANDAGRFAQAVQALCSEPESFQSFSEQAKKRAGEFDWDLTAATIARKFE